MPLCSLGQLKHGCAVQQIDLHFLFVTFFIPGLWCSLQYMPSVSPGRLKEGYSFVQPLEAQCLAATFSIPDSLCCLQSMPRVSLLQLKLGFTVMQPGL
jgi:hypothetical protein